MTTSAVPLVYGRHRNKGLAALRRERALRLRASGMTFAAIAEEMGYASKGTVHHIVAKAMTEHVAEAVADLRLIEGGRLDALQRAVWDQAMAGDVRAARQVLEIVKARIVLFGLDGECEVPAKPRTVVVPEEAEGHAPGTHRVHGSMRNDP